MGRGNMAYNVWDQGYPNQKDAADTLAYSLADEVCKKINAGRDRIARMDSRPKRTWTPEEPEVHNPYVAQALLEKVIEILQQRA